MDCLRKFIVGLYCLFKELKLTDLIENATIYIMNERMFWSKDVREYYLNSISLLKESDVKVLSRNELYGSIYLILERYLKSGKNKLILVKTSVTGKRSRKHEIDDDLLEVVLFVIRQICPKSQVALVDGPAYTTFKAECNRLNWNVILRHYDIPIIDLNKDSYYKIDNWPVSKTWLEADKIINLCKAKTHRRFGVTLANKNLLGVLTGGVLGYPKLSHKHEQVPRLLYELDTISPKRLNIIDGFRGIEGNGPMHGKSTKSNFMVIGTDSYLCDFQATIEMGFAPGVTLGLIRPFAHCCEKETIKEIDVQKLRRTHIDFFPNISNAWMYQSLSYDFQKQQKYYNILLRNIQRCWKKKM